MQFKVRNVLSLQSKERNENSSNVSPEIILLPTRMLNWMNN